MPLTRVPRRFSQRPEQGLVVADRLSWIKDLAFRSLDRGNAEWIMELLERVETTASGPGLRTGQIGLIPYFSLEEVTMETRMSRPSHWRASLWLALGLLAWRGADAGTLPGPLVETPWLAENLDKVVVLDVRDDSDSFEKRSAKEGAPVNPCGVAKKPADDFNVFGHIPKAALIPFKNLQVKRKVGEVELKGLYPSKEEFEKLMQEAGVNNDSALVITSKGMSVKDAFQQTLLYWALKYYGHDNLAILNGGTAQWLLDKREVEFGKTSPTKGAFKAGTERPEILATTEQVTKRLEAGAEGEQLVDVRGKDLYWGLTLNASMVPPQGKGHIPTAKNFPVVFMVNSMGPAARFYTKDEVLKVAELSKIDTGKPTTLYCDSGANASLGWFVWSEVLGNKQARLYDGSMNEYTNTGSRPLTLMKNE